MPELLGLPFNRTNKDKGNRLGEYMIQSQGYLPAQETFHFIGIFLARIRGVLIYGIQVTFRQVGLVVREKSQSIDFIALMKQMKRECLPLRVLIPIVIGQPNIGELDPTFQFYALTPQDRKDIPMIVECFYRWKYSIDFARPHDCDEHVWIVCAPNADIRRSSPPELL